VKAEARLARTHACVGSSPVRRRYRCPRRIAASPSPSYASRRLRWKRQDATRVCTRTARGAAKCSILARVCDAPEVVAAAHFNGLQAWHPHPFHHFARHPNALTQRPPRRCVPLTGVRLCHRPHCCVIVQSAARVCVACARASHCDSLRITSAGFPRARLRSLLQRWSRLSVLGGGWVQLYHCHRTPHDHTRRTPWQTSSGLGLALTASPARRRARPPPSSRVRGGHGCGRRCTSPPPAAPFWRDNHSHTAPPEDRSWLRGGGGGATGDGSWIGGQGVRVPVLHSAPHAGVRYRPRGAMTRASPLSLSPLVLHAGGHQAGGAMQLTLRASVAPHTTANGTAVTSLLRVCARNGGTWAVLRLSARQAARGVSADVRPPTLHLRHGLLPRSVE